MARGQERWTTAQERVMRDYADQGARAVVVALYRECGVCRTERCVRVHASRMGMSLRKRFTCPRCGHVGGPGDFRFGDGLCEACHLRRLSEGLDREDEAIQREYERRLADAERENAKMRQRVSRHRRKLDGLINGGKK